jgi:hypothetical protein
MFSAEHPGAGRGPELLPVICNRFEVNLTGVNIVY